MEASRLRSLALAQCLVTSNNIASGIKIWQIMDEESCITSIKCSYPESRITQIITSPKLSSLLRMPSLRAARNVKVKQMSRRDDEPRIVFIRRAKRPKRKCWRVFNPCTCPSWYKCYLQLLTFSFWLASLCWFICSKDVDVCMYHGWLQKRDRTGHTILCSLIPK